MAVIKTETRYHLGQKWVMKVRCNSDGLFRVKLPAAASQALEVLDGR